jgi:hypothetical protein
MKFPSILLIVCNIPEILSHSILIVSEQCVRYISNHTFVKSM